MLRVIADDLSAEVEKSLVGYGVSLLYSSDDDKKEVVDEVTLYICAIWMIRGGLVM